MPPSRRYPALTLMLALCTVSVAGQQAAPSPSISFNELNGQANSGDAIAQEQLGTCYSLGFCVGVAPEAQIKQDDTKAAQWFQKAAAQGNALAESDLATAYRFGLGLPRDKALAFQWLQRAAVAGDTGARLTLGLAYENGTDVPKDIAQAHVWLRRAADSGSVDAKAELEKLEAFARLDESAKELQKFIDNQSAPNSTATPASPAPAPIAPGSAATPTRGLAPELPPSAPNPAGPSRYSA
jgi:TPR repeat protein